MVAPISAVIFDTDGVVTKTAAAHFAAWKRLFDDFLRSRAGGDDFEPFTDDDYRRHVDGIPRFDGVERFLESRGISLPRGSSDDPPGEDTVCALGNRKNGYFVDHVHRHGVEAFPGTTRFVEQLLGSGIRTAVISASRNCEEVLRAAGVDHLFEIRVDGIDADVLGLPGKPDPAIFLEAARRLGADPASSAIVEDAMLGVEAGRRGGFGLVIGVDRTAHPDALEPYSDMVVPDLADLAVNGGRIERLEHPAAWLPELSSALEDDDVVRRLEGRRPAVFLDYDGTLTPIVARPELAVLPPDTLAALETLAGSCVVAIISGRDLDDIRAMVPTDRLWFAGSHGLDLASPEGWHRDFEEGRRLLGALDAAERDLEEVVPQIPEAWVERKRFADRGAPPPDTRPPRAPSGGARAGSGRPSPGTPRHRREEDLRAATRHPVGQGQSPSVGARDGRPGRAGGAPGVRGGRPHRRGRLPRGADPGPRGGGR